MCLKSSNTLICTFINGEEYWGLLPPGLLLPSAPPLSFQIIVNKAQSKDSGTWSGSDLDSFNCQPNIVYNHLGTTS